MKKAPLLSIVFVFLLPILVGFKSFSSPFTLVSDGKLVQVSKEVIEKRDMQILLTEDKSIGLFRPAYWLTQIVPYAVSGTNPASFHIFHILLFSLTAMFIFLTIYSISKSNLGAVAATIGYTFTTSTSVLWNSLSYEEPILNLFLSIALFTVTKINTTKKETLICLFSTLLALTLATFTKQTSVFIIPGLILLSIISIFSIKKITKYVQGIIVVTLFEIIYALILISSGSIFNFISQKDLILQHLRMYIDVIQKDTGWFLPISLLLFLFVLIRKSKDLRHDTAMFKVFCVFFFSLSVSFLLALSIKPDFTPRLLSPIFLPLYIFIGCSLSYLFSITRRLKKAVLGRLKVLGHMFYVGFIIYCFVFFYFQIKEVAKEISSDIERVSSHSDMVKNLAKNLDKETKIYFSIAESSFEYGKEAGTHLNIFYGKLNEVKRLNPYMLPSFNNGDLIVVSHQFQDIPDSTINQILSRKILLYNTYLWTIYKIER